MNRDEVRSAWVKDHEQASSRALTNKRTEDVFLALFARYRGLSDPDREVVDDLLVEEAGSSDENVRCDALAVIREFRIDSALQALRILADRLETMDTPGAPYEWAEVNQLIGLLVERNSA